MNVVHAPGDYRQLRIVTAGGLAFLALIQTPHSILRAGMGVGHSVNYVEVLAIGVVVLAATCLGYGLLARMVSRTADHRLVARYVSDVPSVVTAASKLVAYVFIVVLAAVIAVNSLIPILDLRIVSTPIITSILILVLALPSIFSHQPNAKLLKYAMVPAAVGMIATIVTGLFLELIDGINVGNAITGGTIEGRAGTGLEWPLGIAAVGACLPAALTGLLTERSFGEASVRRVSVQSVLAVLLPTTLVISASLYLMHLVEMPTNIRLSPLLALGEIFFGTTGAAIIGIAFFVAAVGIGFAAYSQVALYLRALATDGILPKNMAPADAHRPRRIVIIAIALACSAASLLMETSLGVSTGLVVVLFVAYLLVMIGLIARGRKIMRDSTILEERKDGKISIRVGLLLGLLAVAVLVLAALVQPFYTIVAFVVLLVPSIILLLFRRGRGKVVETLAAGDLSQGRILPTRVHVIVLVERLDRPTLQAISYARATRPSTLTGLVVDVDPSNTEALTRDWRAAELPVELRILGTPRGAARRPVIDHVRSLRKAAPRDIVIIYAPRVVSSHAMWKRFFVRHSTPALLSELKLEPGVIVAEVPYQLEDSEEQ